MRQQSGEEHRNVLDAVRQPVKRARQSLEGEVGERRDDVEVETQVLHDGDSADVSGLVLAAVS
jgi:hypothetical protein